MEHNIAARGHDMLALPRRLLLLLMLPLLLPFLWSLWWSWSFVALAVPKIYATGTEAAARHSVLEDSPPLPGYLTDWDLGGRVLDRLSRL